MSVSLSRCPTERDSDRFGPPSNQCTVHAAYAVVHCQLRSSEPSHIPEHVGNMIVLSLSTYDTCTEVQYLLNAVQLCFAARPIHRHAISHYGDNKGLNDRLQRTTGYGMSSMVEGNEDTVTLTSHFIDVRLES